MGELLTLADRVQHATPDIGGDLSLVTLEDEVKRALWDLACVSPRGFLHSAEEALDLVPPDWRVAAICEREPWFCRLETRDFKSVTWGKGSDWITDITAGREATGTGATPALAICAAALRSRALAPIEARRAET